jgi:hypothetical protein
MSEDILDYTDLVARYQTGLIENLRSFGFQTEYLDLWVPDEDLSRSLLNLFDAAAEVGHRSLAVRIPADAIAGLKQAGLPDLAAKRGRFSMDNRNGSVVLRIADLRVVAAPLPVAPAIASTPGAVKAGAAPTATETRSDETLHQPSRLSEPYAGNLAAADQNVPVAAARPGLVQARAEIDGLMLESAVDPTDHSIQSMAATGARAEVARTLLAAVARLCHGLPILEAADHGAIRLEYLLRGDAPRPHAGIVIPETIDPAFRFVSVLLRDLLADYRRTTGFRDSTNTFDIEPGPRWMLADDSARRALLAKAFALGGFGAEDVNVVAIEHDVRVVVSLGGLLAKDPARALAVLERQMKQRVDGRLELFMQEVKDSNKLRRLSEQKSKAS